MAMTIEDITEAERRDLMQPLLQPTSDEKAARDHVRLRYNILHDRVVERELNQWIIDMYHQPEIAAEVMRHKMRLHNPVKRAVDQLAVLYQRKPTREIRKGKNALKGPTQQWNDFLRSMLYDKQMRKLNRYAILANAGVNVLRPRKLGGKTIFDFLPVLKSIGRAVREDGAAMQDPPGILAWLTCDPDAYHIRRDPSAPVLATADSRWILQWNAELKMLPALAIEHGLGRFPGATFRNTLPDDSCPLDYWDPWTNGPIVEAQQHTFRIVAEMNWTRKTQAGKIITATMDDDRPGEKPFAGQVPGDRDTVLIARGQQASVAVHDLTTLVTGFREHLDLIQNVSMEILTGTVSAFVAPDPGQPMDPEIAKRMHGSLSQHQEDQIDHFELTEHELAEVLAQWSGRLGLDVPASEQVRDGFSVSFTELPALETPKERLEIHEKRVAMGLESLIDARVEETGETREEAREQIERRLTEQADFNDIRTTRNSPASATGNAIVDPARPGERDEQTTGRFGGQASPNTPDSREEGESEERRAAPPSSPPPPPPRPAPAQAAAPEKESGDDEQESADEAEASPSATPIEPLNGAQMLAVVAIAEKVAAKTLPRDAAVAIVRAGLPPERAALAEDMVPK